MLEKYLIEYRIKTVYIQGPTFTAAIQGIDPYIIYFWQPVGLRELSQRSR